MFRLREKGCDSHVHIYGYCDKLRPESHVKRFEAKRVKLSMWLYSENSYIQTNKERNKKSETRKVVCNVFA